MQKSSEIVGDSQEFSEILSQFPKIISDLPEIVNDLQKTLVKSNKDFKFSYETQGDKIKIQIEFSKDSVKQEDEGWISNIGNDTYTWPNGCGVWHDTLIECALRNGSLVKHLAGDIYSLYWNEVDNESTDIMKFRIVK